MDGEHCLPHEASVRTKFSTTFHYLGHPWLTLEISRSHEIKPRHIDIYIYILYTLAIYIYSLYLVYIYICICVCIYIYMYICVCVNM